MEKHINFENNQDKKAETNAKLEKMRIILTDEQKCKEIAQKLCAYISGK